jgi:Domain of unknown function (DUF5666)
MNKKILIPIVLVGLAGLIFGGVAYAAGSKPTERPGRLGLGLVTAVGDNQITVQTFQGETRTVLVDENTRYLFPDGSEASFSDIQIGRWIGGRVVEGEPGQLIARGILILPEGFDPARVTVRAGGRVTSVDAASGSFSIVNRQGDSFTFSVDANTTFVGRVQSLSDLQVDMLAGVGAADQNGSLLAVVVRAGLPLIRHRGEITAVDTANKTFTLQTRSDESFTFSVDGDTRFFGKNGDVNGLADLQPGMVAGVGAHQLEDGTYLVVGVIAAHREDLPRFDYRVRGEVISVGEAEFTIQTHQGEQVTFLVSEETRFRSPGGFVRSLEDLQPGMCVGVGAEDLGSGQYLARTVIAVRGTSR